MARKGVLAEKKRRKLGKMWKLELAVLLIYDLKKLYFPISYPKL
jgi:hypothetical protein